MSVKHIKISSHSFVKHEPEVEPIEVVSFGKPKEKKRSRLVNKKDDIATAANETSGERNINNKQTGREITVYRKIKLVHSPSDPLTASMKMRIEKAVRQNFCIRVALKLREYSAFRKQKLVIDLLPSDKAIMTQQAQTARIKELTEAHADLLKEQESIDNNLGLPEKLKTLAWQCWMYGRNALLILYDSEKKDQVNRLFQINSRRLGEPVLNEEEDLKFEGCIIDGTGLDKDSMIYATYEDRELSPHTEGYGYSIVELCLLEAEAHTYMIQNVKEVALSAFLPTVLLKIDTDNLQGADKNTKISNVSSQIAPGKILSVPTDVEEAEMLDMKPDYAGYVLQMDSLEAKIYNTFHTPLFLVKSDEIATRATANKSAKLFFDGPVTDDQNWMENLLGRQWYDPILREKLKAGKLKVKGSEEIEKTVDTSDPVDTEAPLPFVIRRKFELPTIEDFIDLADALVALKQNSIWDTTKANEILGSEEVTTRVTAEEKQKQDLELERLKSEARNTQLTGKNNQEIATASKGFIKKKEEILAQIAKKLESM